MKDYLNFTNVYFLDTASVVGVKEGKGPLSACFDMILDDDSFGENSWEKAESKMLYTAIKKVIYKSKITENEVDYSFCGDLLNQCVSSHYAMRDINLPFVGIYGACSTFVLSLIMGSITISGGFAEKVVCASSSHFCAAEKQFRFPLDYGGQRPPSSQWTVTGAGAVVLDNKKHKVKAVRATIGKIIDKGVSDLNNMGAAMAPAAVDTVERHLKNNNLEPGFYDKIFTGDLGVIGSDIFLDLLNEKGLDLYSVHEDCGKIIYDIKKDDVHSGASGCGCVASVFCGYIFKEIEKNNYKRVLLVATGALMNSMTVQQGESIPVIAHAIEISVDD